MSLDDEAESSIVRVKGSIALALIPTPAPVLPPVPVPVPDPAPDHVPALPPARTPTPALPSTPAPTTTPTPVLADRECTHPEGSSFEMKASDSCTIFLPVVAVAGCLDCSVLECVLVGRLFVFEEEDDEEEELR